MLKSDESNSINQNLKNNSHEEIDPELIHPTNPVNNPIIPLESGKKPKKKKKYSQFFMNFKDFLLLLLLLGSSISNFSILNILFTLGGVSFIFLLFNHKKWASKTKYIFVIIIMIYSIMCISIKTVIIILDLNNIGPISAMISENKNLFLDLGFRYLEVKDNFRFINTFLAECLVLLGNIFYLIIRCCNRKNFNERKNSFLYTATEKWSNMFLCLISLVTLGITCANISLMTILYSALIHLGLFLWSIKKNTRYHRIVYYLLSFLFVVHIILTHIFNIYDLRKKFMVGSSTIRIIKWIGVMKMKTSVEYFTDYSLNVLGICICILTIKFSYYGSTADEPIVNCSTTTQDLNYENSLWSKFKSTFIKYVFSPYFTLHICRLASIYWIWRFVNFPAVGMLFWLFYSFLILNSVKMKYITYIVTWSCLIYSYNVFMLTNTKDLIDFIITDENREILKQYGIEKFDIPILEFLPIQLTIVFFAIFMKTNLNKDKNVNLIESKTVSENDLNENLILEDNLNQMKDKPKSTEIYFNDLIAKSIIFNVDKLTCIFMYFIANEKVNLTHLILTIIFMIQLIIPQLIKKICLIIIIAIEFIFAFEYIIDLIKIHFVINEELNDILNIIIEFDNKNMKESSTEFFLPFIIYCLYTQYQNYNSSIYKSLNNENISFQNYLTQLLKNHGNFKSFVLFIIFIFQEIYIWIILVAFFLFICAFDKYVSFGIKLILFFIVMYKFLNLSRNIDKASKISKYVWILISYCGINTLIVYFYQFTLLKYFNEWYKNFEESLPEWILNNLYVLGLDKYTEKFPIKFLPHYGTNFLSVILLWEIKRIIQIKNDMQIKNFGVSNSDRNEIKNEKEIESMHTTQNKIEVNVKTEDFVNNTELNVNKLGSPQKETLPSLKLHPVNYFKFYTFKGLVFLCKSYWLCIFISISAFFVSYQISLAMVIYVIIFSISLLLMFKNIISSIQKFLTKNNKFFISRLMRFSIIEKPRNIKIFKVFRKKTFKYLLISGMSYIILTYFYTLFDIIQTRIHNSTKPYPMVDKNTEEFIISISYIIGVYVKDTSNLSFISSIWGHITMIMLISFDIYMQKIQNFLNDDIIKTEKFIKLNEKYEKEKTINKLNKLVLLTSRKVSGLEAEEIKIRTESFKSAISIHENFLENEIGRREHQNTSLTIFRNNQDDDSCIIKRLLDVFKNYKKSKQEDEEMCKNINYQFDIQPKSNNLTLGFFINVKKIIEEFIVLLILISAIIKLNVVSLIYILLVLFLQIKGKNISRIYLTTFFVCIFTILQTSLFLSNVNINTDPTANVPVLGLIQKKLNIPWYPQYTNDSWAFFLSLGVNHYQINTIWIDFIVIITCFIYLDIFCYSIYDSESQSKGNPTHKINFYHFREKKTIKKAITRITQEEYNWISRNLKLNFEIELISLDEMRNIIFNRNNKNENAEFCSKSKFASQVQSLQNKKGKCMKLLTWIKKTIYLTMHNSLLIITLILSMMNTGLLSTFYIIFSLYYLYQSNSLVLSKRYSFPESIKRLLRIFLICDLFVQLAYQIPLNLNLKKYDWVFASIGINKTVDYENGPDPDKFIIKSTVLVIFKAVTYFLVSLQVMIYSSKDFQEFYIGFILKKKDSLFRNSMMNAFLFNNKRIKSMQAAMDNKKKIDNVLIELELQLEKWNTRLNTNDINGTYRESNDKENNSLTLINTDIKKGVSKFIKHEIVKNQIKMKIMENFLISFAIIIQRKTANYKFIEKEHKQEFENSVVKGDIFIRSELERKIDKFIEELNIDEIEEKEFEKIIELDINEINDQNENDSDNKKFDYKKYENYLHDNLFTKYMTKYYLISQIVWSISKFLIDNLEYICFFIMFLNHFFYNSLISLFWPIAVFGFGLIEYPRPSKIFWKTCLFYSSMILVIKFGIQLFNLMKNFPIIRNFFTTLQHFKIGLNVYDSTYSSQFLSYIIWDAVLIFFLMMQEYVLIERGIWDKIENEQESVEEANDRIFKAKSIPEEQIDEYTEDIFNKIRMGDIISEDERNFKSIVSLELDNNVGDVILESKIVPEEVGRTHKYFEDLFPRIRNYKPGQDFYAYYTVTGMILLVYIIFFYTDMDQDNMFKLQGTSAVRQFSGTMVLIAFFHAIVSVIDRIIYVQQSRNNLEFEFAYYSKETGEKLSPSEVESLEFKVVSPKDMDKFNLTNPNVNVIYYQKETVNYPLIFKYVLQIVILILSHIFIFFFLPITGNYNLQNSYYCEPDLKCNDFSVNIYIQIFYVIYCVYLFFSAIQIHYGLNDMRKKSLLQRGDNIFYSTCFKIYNAIPFLYELKLTLDWTCTPTCLDLFKWLKFESVYDLLFITHCTKKAEEKMPIGQKIGLPQKILMGGLSFSVLLALLLGPLLIFSTLNPTNESNNVTGANIKLSICFQQSEDRVFNNFTLFKNDFVDSIREISTTTWNKFGYANSSLTKNFPIKQVQDILMSDTSDTIWDIAGPHIVTIIDKLKNYKNNTYNIYFGFEYSFARPSPVNAKEAAKTFDYPLYVKSLNIDKNKILENLLDDIENCKQNKIKLDNFYNPALRLSSQPHPKVIWDNSNFKNVTALLNFVCNKTLDSNIDYTKSYYLLTKYDFRDTRKGLVFHTFSDKVSTTSAAYDVVTFYISFVIVIGRLIRGFISGEAEKIVLTEMPEPKNLINLCEGIKISRYRYNFEREEHLYYVLIDFMRSPEILKLLTKSSLKKFQERQELNKN